MMESPGNVWYRGGKKKQGAKEAAVFGVWQLRVLRGVWGERNVERLDTYLYFFGQLEVENVDGESVSCTDEVLSVFNKDSEKQYKSSLYNNTILHHKVHYIIVQKEYHKRVLFFLVF